MYAFILMALACSPAMNDSLAVEDAAIDDSSDLQGRWEPIAIRCNGIYASTEDVPLYFAFRHDKFLMGDDNSMREVASFRVRRDRNPAELELQGMEEGWRGIFRRRGDVLDLAISLGDQAPRDFISERGSDVFLVTLRRVRK
jgi:uncharacterized protein (TIGR03067 family)